MNFKQEKIGSHAKSDDNKEILSLSSEKKSMYKESGISRLPQRYVIKNSSDTRILTCLDAPDIAVQVEAGLTVSASAALKSPAGTIYLDGVAQSEPFMDHEKQIYNFDHHEGCLRPFTLSTCEQVLLMILKGLDLRSREWSVFANEPDLDTILSIWLLLNHQRIQQKDSGHRKFLYALVRHEGIIDSHGLEMTEFSGLPTELLIKTKKVIDYLRAEEIDLKKKAIWEEKDSLELTAMILHKIDRIIYRANDFADFKEIRELARVDLGTSRIAVIVQADQGIYELEPYLQKVYGEKLGLAALKTGEGKYTLRRLNPFMPGDLDNVYPILNYIDPAVGYRTNSPQWGGSGDIGGSPRGIATKLSDDEIAQACRDAFQHPRKPEYLTHFFYSLVAVCAIIGVAAISNFYLSSSPWLSNLAAAGLISKTYFSFFVAMVLFTAAGIFLISGTQLSRFGIGIPRGNVWWVFLPVIILTAMAKGVYFPDSVFRFLNLNESVIYVFITIPLATELLFRGLAHGILVKGTTVQSYNSRWFFSYPVIISAILYAAFITSFLFLPEIFKGTFQAQTMAETAFAAFSFGLVNGVVRERSHSIFPAIVFHLIAFLAIALFLI
ncbi:MAG: CPBP family intramembrane metalloprotease [Deltaproteobacteria bacterium]|nr:CPBP family intramembrane metalloprotease [Deltaproteobacteria bacterium]